MSRPIYGSNTQLGATLARPTTTARAISPWHWLLTGNVLVDNQRHPLVTQTVVDATLVAVGGRRFTSLDPR